MSRTMTSEFSINGMGLTSNPYSPYQPRKKYPEPARRTRPEFPSARAGWHNRPETYAMDRASTRSRSPEPVDRQQFTARSRTPPKPAATSRYLYIPREYHSPPKLKLSIPQSNRPTPQPQPHSLPISRIMSDIPETQPAINSTKPRAGPVSQQSINLLPKPARPTETSSSQMLVPKPLSVRGQPPSSPRQSVPSMVEYLSLEQLESLWQSQDMYLGTIVAPEQPTSPLSSMVEEFRSPILPVHPAFRNDPHNDPNFTSITCA